MKRTFTINLGNLVYHIDDDAYDLLKNYLRQIEQTLSNEADRKEIMADIEFRISELFSSRIQDYKQVVTLEDVKQIIEILGDASEFSDDETSESTSGNSNKAKTSYSSSKRLYRDPDNRSLGGVCGGLGAYTNTDPVIFRILFVAVFLIGGAGGLVYLIMWIVIPEARTTAQRLEMRGEAVTLENIKRAVREEFENVKSKMKF